LPDSARIHNALVGLHLIIPFAGDGAIALLVRRGDFCVLRPNLKGIAAICACGSGVKRFILVEVIVDEIFAISLAVRLIILPGADRHSITSRASPTHSGIGWILVMTASWMEKPKAFISVGVVEPVLLCISNNCQYGQEICC
jgi:hypothetical protein